MRANKSALAYDDDHHRHHRCKSKLKNKKKKKTRGENVQMLSWKRDCFKTLFTANNISSLISKKKRRKKEKDIKPSG